MNRKDWLTNSRNQVSDEDIVSSLEKQVKKLHPDYKLPEIFTKEAVRVRGKYTPFFSSALLRDIDRWNKGVVMDILKGAMNKVENSEEMLKAIDASEDAGEIFKEQKE